MSQNFPKIKCIEQKIESPQLLNIKSNILKKIKKLNLKALVSKGEKIAITASSRGITNQDLILKTIVEYLNDLDTKPFIVPAMGSHGGGTVEGQLNILEEYGITSLLMGCPIKATMDVVSIGKSEFGTPVYIDKFVAEADKIIIVNKINSHSKFVGDVESGLSKMCLIGLGKHEGAKLYHRLIENYTWPTVVKSLRKIILEKLPIICGFAIIQNAQNHVSELHLLRSNEIAENEPKLLKKFKKIRPKIPFNELDLLIVDEMGKNIFGTGMDTNIIGRKSDSSMKVKWVFVRDLSKETNGNAQGIGLADFTTKRLVDKIDYSQTYENALTAYRTDSAKIPIYLSNDRDVLKKVFEVAGVSDPAKFRLVWIKNTLELDKMLVSEYFFDKIRDNDNLKVIDEAEDFKFDNQGFLLNSKNYW
ncbi:MAG: lactate racemase domain-containing protein [Candidatus Izemoplasmatales bacterium]